jgi:myo-inositol-1(or 4)-monophosphatase
MFPSIPTTQLMQVAEIAARAGGAALREWTGRFSTREKAPADLVTDADVASQEAIRTVIAKQFPEHDFLGEESTDARKLPANHENVAWVVDPLDGTTNYVHSFPFFSVSVAAVRGDRILAGVVYDPLRDLAYRAGVGEGAWLREKRLRTSSTAKLSDALTAVSFPAQVRDDSPDLLDFLAVVGQCQAVRRTGSAALNLAAVAAGQLDAHWAWAINAWDVAAGVLLIQEAGGVVTAANGGPFDLWKANYLAASTPMLHNELCRRLGRQIRSSGTAAR